MSDRKLDGKAILQDENAISSDASLPAFVGRPAGAPVYHGFPLIPETECDGWIFGAITDFNDPAGCEFGDAFVQAPDGSRAGIVWEVGQGEFSEVCKPEPGRWGVWAVWFDSPVRNVEDFARAMQSVLPWVKEKYSEVSGG